LNPSRFSLAGKPKPDECDRGTRTTQPCATGPGS
jgi:hypothetical protein